MGPLILRANQSFKEGLLMAKKTKHEISLTAGQAGEVLAPIMEVVLGMKSRDAQYWIGKKGKLASEMRKILIRSNGNEGVLSSILDWQNFYKEYFNLNLDLSTLAIPAKPTEGNWRLLIIADISLESLYVKCKEKFRCWRWTNNNLDKIVTFNERDAKSGSYAIWVRDEIEADEKYKNFSANHIKEIGTKTETLAERLIHELKFFQETGKHLDIENVTLCAGSRYGDSSVPDMHWSDGKMYVSWYRPVSQDDDLRAREVVS